MDRVEGAAHHADPAGIARAGGRSGVLASASEGDEGEHQAEQDGQRETADPPAEGLVDLVLALFGERAASATAASDMPLTLPGAHRTWPSPTTTYFVDVISGSPIGPRACSFWVLMPISAPKPNSPPSVNRVDALTSTAAESTAAVKCRAAAWSSVTIASLCPLENSRMCEIGVVQAGYDGRGDVEREVLGPVVLVGGRHDPVVGREDLVAVDGHAGLLERGDDPRQERVGDLGVHEQRLGGVADAGPVGLGVETIASALSRSAARST